MATILFAISLIMVFGLLALKMRELSTGKVLLLGALSQRTDPVLRGYFLRTIHFFRIFNRKTGVLFLHFLLEHTILLSKALKRRLDSKQSKFLTMVKGKPDIRRKGSASFFLKHIKEHKDQLRKEEMKG
jgi:hypothetical protein